MNSSLASSAASMAPVDARREVGVAGSLTALGRSRCLRVVALGVLLLFRGGTLELFRLIGRGLRSPQPVTGAIELPLRGVDRAAAPPEWPRRSWPVLPWQVCCKRSRARSKGAPRAPAALGCVFDSSSSKVLQVPFRNEFGGDRERRQTPSKAEIRPLASAFAKTSKSRSDWSA